MTEFEQKMYDDLKKKADAYEADNRLLRDLIQEFVTAFKKEAEINDNNK